MLGEIFMAFPTTQADFGRKDGDRAGGGGWKSEIKCI